MNPTQYRTEWVSSPEYWDEPTEGNGRARFRRYETDDKEMFVGGAPLTDGFISLLRRRYDFRDELTVETFLREHRFLGDLLFDAYEAMREYFPPGTRAALKVSIDPEARGDGQLFVLIQTKLRPRAARTFLSVLDQEWWQGMFPETEGKMTISLEYL
jgi:hypothetical protein